MHKHRTYGLALVFFVLADGAAALAFVGCSGDDTTAAVSDGGGDGTVDSAPDVVVAPDARNDADAQPPEGGLKDTGLEASFDGSLQGFPDLITRTLCSRLETCCLLNNTNFDTGKCVSLFEMFGGFRDTFYVQPDIDGGHIAFDGAKAMACVNGIANIPCGLVTGASLSAIADTCFAAMPGTLTAGASCRSDFECAQGYCKPVSPPVDGGPTATCAPLEAQGGSCQTSYACSPRATGDTNLYCDPDAGQCVATVANDAGRCSQNNDCQSHGCKYPTCVAQIVFTDPGVPNGTCDFFTIKDAGGGG